MTVEELKQKHHIVEDIAEVHDGGEPDYYNAIQWLIKAAELNNLKAYELLGECFYGGYGVEKIYKKDYEDTKQMYDYIIEHKAYLVEQCVIQHEKLNELYPYAVNTYRIMTILTGDNVDVINAYVRIGNNGAVVDNHHSGGMASPVDIETGEILYPAIDIDCNIFDIHPMTNTKIVGFRLPCWKESIDLVKKAMADLDLDYKEVAIRGGTDGANLTWNGVLCPNLGTGGQNFHGVHEFWCKQEGEKVVELLTHILNIAKK